MTWKKGERGNPAGKPAGARNKATVMVLGLMERGAKEITEAIVSAAKAGDLGAARLVLDRLVPPAKERPIFLDLPDTGSVKGHRAGSGCHPASGGGRRPSARRGRDLGRYRGSSRRKAVETQELEARFTVLETKK